ncbi:ArnT family glycosyltransferase [Maritalea sp. S77]|uniref:ArnT family glycosyltransferase n=1 Tax=Maritalea sp. S77 TaxID=3415125 RepID=UPI003C7DA1AF
MVGASIQYRDFRFLPVKALIFFVGLLLVLKLGFTFFTKVAADEAYYWLWGQHFDWSYFDHPPLNAWILGVSDRIFGTNVFGLRLPAMLSFAGTAYVMWLFAQRLFPQNSKQSFLIMLVVFLASPTLFVWTTIVYHDHLMLFLCIAAAYCFTDYFARFAEDNGTDVKGLYLAALLLGLAGLTKYAAAFLGVSVALVVLLSSQLRPMLKQKHIYLAGVLTFACMAPVLIWNLQNDWASFQLHFSDRYELKAFEGINAGTFARYLFSTALYFGVFLLIPLIGIFWPRRYDSAFAKLGVRLAQITILTSLGVFIVFAARGTVHWYWSDLAYALMIIFMLLYLRWAWLIWAHVLTSFVFIAYGLVSYGILPFDYLVGAKNVEVGRMHGWDKVAQNVEELQATYNPDVLATTGYPTAGQLAYAMDQKEIFDLSDKRSQFDFWQLKSPSTGSLALILHDHFGDLDAARRKFESFEKVQEFTIEALGIEFYWYEIYLGKNSTPNDVEVE